MGSQASFDVGIFISKVTLVSCIILGAHTQYRLVHAARIPVAPYTIIAVQTINPRTPATLPTPFAMTIRTTPPVTTSRPKTTTKGITTAGTTTPTGTTTRNSTAQPGDDSTTTTTMITTTAPKNETFFDNMTDMCKWLKKNTPYGCDNPAIRWLWRQILEAGFGVTDCNSFCVKFHGKHGGNCTSIANYDISSWCPEGQTCVCT